MADQKNRGGQKQGNLEPENREEHQGTQGDTGGRSDRDKRDDQTSNPDDERRQPTNEQR